MDYESEKTLRNNNNNKEIFPSSSDIISNLIARHKRIIYFDGCNHTEQTYIKNIEPRKWYFCSKCVLFRKISNISY